MAGSDQPAVRRPLTPALAAGGSAGRAAAAEPATPEPRQSRPEARRLPPSLGSTQLQLPPLCCGLLLQLPAALEWQFWHDERTIRSFTAVDILAAGHVLIGNLMLAKGMAEVVTTRALLLATWHVHVTLALNITSCAATLTLILARARFYQRHRHTIVVANRLLRLGCLVLMAVCATPAKHAMMGSWVRPKPHGGQSEAAFALLSLTRPLFLTAMMTLAQGDWVFGAVGWLPLQFVTVALACLGAFRWQPCQMANDPHSVMILQATCRSTTSLQQVLLGLVVGQNLMPLSSPSSGRSDTCSDPYTAARALTVYMQAVYCLLVAGGTYLPFELRLKARFVQQQHCKRLVYGPLRWWYNQTQDSTRSSWWLVPVTLVPAALWGLWVVCLWLAPLLPHEPCTTCADTGGGCPSLGPCDGLLCADPGAATAALLLLQMLAICSFKIFVTRSIYALV